MMRKIYDKVRSDNEFKDLTWEEFSAALSEVIRQSEKEYIEARRKRRGK